MSKELNHIKAVAAYQKSISDEKDIETLIEAVAEGDHSAVTAVIENEIQRRIKAEKTEWMKSRPAVNAGSGDDSAATKEQFNKMNYQQRVEFKNSYPELYKKYTEVFYSYDLHACKNISRTEIACISGSFYKTLHFSFYSKMYYYVAILYNTFEKKEYLI